MASPDDLRLIDRLHGGFPLCDRPFAEVAATLGCTEDMLIDRLQRLLAHGDLTRFGPLFQIERAGGRFVLAAMAVPEERFDAVAAQLGAMPEIAHNYRREHQWNMWFVLGCATPQGIAETIERIEALTGLTVLNLPKEETYHVGLHFQV